MAKQERGLPVVKVRALASTGVAPPDEPPLTYINLGALVTATVGARPPTQEPTLTLALRTGLFVVTGVAATQLMALLDRHAVPIEDPADQAR
jgi:hypothetical protein